MTKDNVTDGFLVALAILACGVWYFSLGEPIEAIPTDPQTSCPVNMPLTRSTVVAIDRTDEFAPEQYAQVTAAIDEAAAKLPTWGLLTIYTFGASVPQEAILERCKPRDGSDADLRYEGTRLIKNRYQRLYSSAVTDTTDSLVTPASAPRTPLFETIRALSELSNLDASIQERRLIVAGDFLANMPAYSHYRDALDYETFEALSYARSVETDLTGVMVTLVYLKNSRYAKYQTKEHRAFIERWFKEMGAVVVPLGESDA